MRALAIAMLVAACYDPPREAACTLACTAATGCPAGLECNGATCTLPGGSCGSGDDGGVDARPTPPDGPAAVCYGNSDGTGLVRICFDPKPSSTVSFDSATEIDTSNAVGCTLHDDGNVEVCVVSAGRLVINSTVRAIGARPLVLAAERIEIAGTLDVAANPDGRPAAGSQRDSDACGTPGLTGLAGAGGPGGSFVGRGGQGGARSGGTGSIARSDQPPDRLRGGCDGQAATQGGLGGQGGGAVYLAADMISISGTIHASGGGGEGSVDNGGGGGASGGFIGIDAPAGGVTITTARLVANGGGGGCGGAAENGAFPNAAFPRVAAVGGCVGAGGEGGTGSVGPTLDGNNGTDGVVGGGGGGGGAGVIRTFANTLAASTNFSPPPQP